MRSLVALFGNDSPGKPSPPVVSILFLGVGLGSTETTDLIGYTRSVTWGLIWPKGELLGPDNGELRPFLSSKLDLADVSCGLESQDCWACGRGSENERWCGNSGRLLAVDEA